MLNCGSPTITLYKVESDSHFICIPYLSEGVVVRTKKLLSISRRKLVESDRKLFHPDIGDQPIEEYRVITVSRFIGPNSLEMITQYLTCVGKLLKLYEHKHHKIKRYGKLCTFYYYDEPSFYFRNGDYKTFNYDDLMDLEKRLVAKIISKVEEDLIEKEELNMIIEALDSPPPQLMPMEEEKHLDDISNGILVGNGKGGFTIYNPK